MGAIKNQIQSVNESLCMKMFRIYKNKQARGFIPTSLPTRPTITPNFSRHELGLEMKSKLCGWVLPLQNIAKFYDYLKCKTLQESLHEFEPNHSEGERGRIYTVFKWIYHKNIGQSYDLLRNCQIFDSIFFHCYIQSWNCSCFVCQRKKCKVEIIK